MSAARGVVAFALLLGVAAGCRTAAPAPRAADAELAKRSRAAVLAYRFASAERARPLFRSALDRAEALGDAAAAGTLGYNLAVCLAESGEPAAALAAARAARRDLERAGLSIAEPLLLEASLLHPAEGEEAALAAAGRALAEARAARRGDLQALALALRAEIAVARGDPAAAEESLAAARRAAGRAPAPGLAARLASVAGRIASRRERFAEAAVAHAEEADLWGRAGLARRVPPALTRAADVALRGGDAAGAARHRFDAARSLAGQGNAAGARAMLDAVEALPPDALDAGLRAGVAALRDRLTPAAAPAP